MTYKKTQSPSSISQQTPPDWADESRPVVEGWIRPTEGLVVTGRIVGHFTIQARDRGERDRDIVSVKLSAPTLAVRPDNDEPTEVPAGTIVGVSLISALENLRYYIEKRGEVWVRYDRKESIGRGLHVWRCTVRCRGIRSSAPPRVQQRSDAADDAADDNLPF